jgi:tetratricopeptide (TPR) repeat protein
MSALKLLQAHRNGEAIAECRRLLSLNPNDIAAIHIMAGALLALERYDEALPLYERVDADEKGRQSR